MNDENNSFHSEAPSALQSGMAKAPSALQSIWTEKYRPQSLKDMVGQKAITEKLFAFVEKKSLPHCLFAGPAGIGKTTAALALANEFFKNQWHRNFLELNSSDERGIDTIRVKVKDFARTMPISGSFKIVCLDEADSLTKDAQHALRRTMEAYAGTCRFILACVSPETKVLLPEEVETTIGEMTGNNISNVISIEEDSKSTISEKVVAHIELDTVLLGKRSYRMTTMSGRKLDLTGDHPLLTTDGWKKTEEISVGDKVAIFPHLENTEMPSNDDVVVISEERLSKLLEAFESSYTKRRDSASDYLHLSTVTRVKMKDRILELSKLLSDSVTKKEYFAYKIIAKNHMISRREIQYAIGVSRIRAVGILKELEKKGFIKRTVEGKIHRFSALSEPSTLRSEMDIKNAVENEFKIKISYKAVCDILRAGSKKSYGTANVLAELKKSNLLPLSYNNPKIGIIARLAGFLLGDGHITKNHQRLIFTSDKESLEIIISDIIKLGFMPSEIYAKELHNTIRGRKFAGTTTWFNVNSKPLALFFECLGIPSGDKVAKEFFVPEWIINGPRFVKREFLRALFGSELESPKCIKRNFNAISFRQHKLLNLSKSAKKYSRQIMDLLGQFEITSKLIIYKLGNKRKNGEDVCEIRITLAASNKNLLNFFRYVGYAYCPGRERKCKLASEYLRHKLHVIELQKKKGEQIQLEFNSSQTLRAIARKYCCSTDFVKSQKHGKDAHLPRDFPTFDDWIMAYKIGDSLLVWNEITSIEDIKLDKVMDITCLKNHNFIANGIVSHNCNYSGKIIPPIQSRCAVFRFSALKRNDIIDSLKDIAKKENLSVEEKAYDAVFATSEGDMRKAINILQMAAASGTKITEKLVYETTNAADPSIVNKMLAIAVKGDFKGARLLLHDLLYQKGLAGEDIIRELHRQIFALDVDDHKKLELIERTGEYEFRITEGANPLIQIESLLAQASLTGAK